MDNNLRNVEIYDILLKNALMERYDKEADDFRSGAYTAEFSKAFEKRASRIKRSINRENRIKAGIGIIVNSTLVIIIAMGVCFPVILTEPTVSAAVGGVIREAFETHDSYYYEGAEDTEISIDDGIRPKYLPENYAIRTVEYGASAMGVVYRHKYEDKAIYFDYRIAQYGSISVDSEHRERTEISKNGADYYFYRSLGDEWYSALLWCDDKYFYCITGPLTQSEMLKMAESVNME